MTPQKSPPKNLSTGTSGTSYQSSKPASTKRHPSASKNEGGHAKGSHASPTTGLSSQHKHQASSRGQRRGPSSIARKDFVDVEHLDLLLGAIDVLAMKGMPGLATSGEGVVPKEHLRLRDEERQVWQAAIELMAAKGEFTVARRLLAMCDTATRAALFQALSQPCLQAMLSNPVKREQRSFVQLIRTTIEHAIVKGRSEWALPLLDMLPPFDRADALLSLTDLHSSPQPLVASKAPEALTRSAAMSDECWEVLVLVLQPVVDSVADQKGQPVLELGPKQISVSQPLQAGRDVSHAFSQ
ncbi:MAG: hypothetical protein GWN66_01205, partial [Pseudomonas stutzeri]|nr:hypothetical protein [Stutzerimonas stutzeri]